MSEPESAGELGAALLLVEAGLKSSNLRLLGSALSALWALCGSEREFYSLLEATFGSRQVEVLAAAFLGFQSVASWTSRLLNRGPEVVDGKLELHILTRKTRGAYRALLAELGVCASGPTLHAAERKLLLALEENSARLWSSFARHNPVEPGVSLRSLSVAAKIKLEG